MFNRLFEKVTVRKILKNFSWLILYRLFNFAITLFVSVKIARYLGPSDLGLLKYVVSFVGIFEPMMNLGLDFIITRNIIREPERKDLILGSATALRFIGWCLSFLFVVSVIFIMKPDDKLIQVMVVITGVSSLFQIFTPISSYFSANLKSNYYVIASACADIVTMANKITLLIIAASVLAFNVANSLQTVFIGIALIIAYRIQGHHITKWKVNFKYAINLLRDSWPYFLSAFSERIYFKIDQIMLGQMINNYAVGVYSVSVQITSMWYYVPTAIAVSVLPSIIKSKSTHPELYYNRLQKYYDFITWLSIIVAIIIVIYANLIIKILLGEQYKDSTRILQLQFWSAVFGAQGVSANNWLLAENLQMYALYFTAGAALINVTLNYYLIPLYSGTGAAIAGLFSTAFSMVLAPLIFPKTRKCGQQLLLAYLAPIRYGLKLKGVFRR